MPIIWTAAAGIAAYLLGSVSFAVVVSRAFGLADPRTYGSKNPGATNVLRSGSKAAAVLTLVGDAAKGWFAVWLARRYGAPIGIDAWARRAGRRLRFSRSSLPGVLPVQGRQGRRDSRRRGLWPSTLGWRSRPASRG